MSGAAGHPARPRLVLVTPRPAPGVEFAAALAAALAGGDVAAVLIDLAGLDDASAQRLAEALVPVAQQAGAAAVVAGDTRIAGRARADGVHVEVPALIAGALGRHAPSDEPEPEDDDGADPAVAVLAAVVDRQHPERSAGAGGIRGRHDAMLAAEAGVDYVLFGRLELAEADAPHPKTLGFAEWWAPIFETPCIALAGRSIEAIGPLVATGAEFIALRAAAWEHPDGPGAAVAAANRTIDDAMAAT
jgi:thiamine-phosphate pyrophosphorylase